MKNLYIIVVEEHINSDEEFFWKIIYFILLFAFFGASLFIWPATIWQFNNMSSQVQQTIIVTAIITIVLCIISIKFFDYSSIIFVINSVIDIIVFIISDKKFDVGSILLEALAGVVYCVLPYALVMGIGCLIHRMRKKG